MGDAVEKIGLNIHYCMSLPRHILHPLQVPRVSIDYHHQLHNEDQT
jgi:hypothetical protein